MKKNSLFLIITLIFSSTAFARNWYADGGLGLMNFDDGNASISPTNIYLRGGYQLNKYLNFGLETNFTLSPDQVSNVDANVDTLTAYARGGTPVNKYLWVYGQLGVTNTRFSAGNSKNNSDLMYGFGAEIYPVNKPVYIALNYSNYFDNGIAEVTALNLGVGYRF